MRFIVVKVQGEINYSIIKLHKALLAQSAFRRAVRLSPAFVSSNYYYHCFITLMAACNAKRIIAHFGDSGCGEAAKSTTGGLETSPRHTRTGDDGERARGHTKLSFRNAASTLIPLAVLCLEFVSLCALSSRRFARFDSSL